MSAFLGFFSCLIAVIGRAACIDFFCLESPPEFGVDGSRMKQILSVNLLRHKTANDGVQSIAIFPSCSSLFQDFYFSLAYNFVMIDGTPSKRLSLHGPCSRTPGRDKRYQVSHQSSRK